jgi:hypothetical protein
VLGASVGLARDVAGPAETLTVPLAALLLALGVQRMRRRSVSSWHALGPGLAVLLLPSLLLASVVGGAWRVVALALVATAAVVAGLALRWQAPLLAGGAVLVVHAVVQLAPWLAQAYEALPRWLTLGLAGALLLALGARYERRLRDLRAVRVRVAAMR